MIQISPMWAAVLAAFVVFMAYTIILLFAWLLWMVNLKKNNIDIVMRDATKSNPVLRLERARVVDHKKYGPFIYIKRTGEVLPRFSDNYFFPTSKSGRKLLDVTKKEDLYTANDIEMAWKKGYPIVEDIKEYFGAKTSRVFPVLYKMVDFITQPISFNARTFAFTAKEIVNEKTKPDEGFWEKHRATVIAMGMLGVTMVVCVVMVIFTQQYADGLIQAANGNAASNAAELARNMIENAPKG